MEIELELVEACKNGNILKVEELLSNPENPINYFGEVFLCACEEGHREIVELLLNDERIDIKSIGASPFKIACEKGHVGVVELLLNDQRVDVTKENKKGHPPFYVACLKGYVEIVKLLLNDERIDLNKVDDSGQTPFYIACEHRCTEVVKVLLNHQKIERNKPNKNGWTPFYIACVGRTEIVKLLLNDEGIDINQETHHGETPFHIACKNGHIEIVQYLLASGREITLTVKDKDGKTAIDCARDGEKSEKKIWESEEDFQRRKGNCSRIVELIESFQRNPNETRSKRLLRGKILLFSFFFFLLSKPFFFLKKKKKRDKCSI